LFIVSPLEKDKPEVDTTKITVLASNNVKVSVPSKIDRPVKNDKPKRIAQACRTVRTRTRETVKPNSKAVVLDDAMRLRNNLRETLGSVNALILSIKSQRKQDKLLRDTVNSLRKLQNV
jgi:predicted phosphatase